MSNSTMFLSIKHALEILEKPSSLERDKDEVLIDDHRWLHVWASSKPKNFVAELKAKDISFEQGLRRLHEIYVKELMRRHFEHQSPLTFQAPIVTQLQKTLKPFSFRVGGVQWVGSSVKGKVNPNDIDLVIKLDEEDPLLVDQLRAQFPENIKPYLEYIWDTRGAHGPYINAGDFYFIPTKEVKVSLPEYHIGVGDPILPAYPDDKIKAEFAQFLPELGWYVENKPTGIRMTIHRRLDELKAFDKEATSIEVPDVLIKEFMGVQDPSAFILDGIWSDSDNIFYMTDILWWRETELIELPEDHRKGFLTKFPGLPHVKVADWMRCLGGDEVAAYLNDIKPKRGDEFVIKDASSEYSLNGVSPNWYLLEWPETTFKAASASDEQIKELVDSSGWEKKSADEKVEMMERREKIEPLYPFMQLKTSKRGYQVREAFGIKPIEDLARAWFKTPNKVAVETKFDGYRNQIHKKGDQVKIYTEGGLEVGHILPNLVKDVKELKCESCIFDTEVVPYDKDGSALGRRAAAKAYGGKAVVDDSLWVAHCFDILWLNGKDLHELPYEERRKTLKGLELPVKDIPDIPPKFHIQENIVDWANTYESMMKLTRDHSAVKYSEGAMFKQAISKYPLSGQTPLWAKMKSAFEIDAIVCGRKPKIYTKGPEKGKPVPGQWTYVGAIGPISKPAEKTPNIKDPPINESSEADYVKIKGQLYAVTGDTFATNEDMKVGDIVRVNVDKMREISDTRYHWLIPKVLEKREDKTRPDPLSVAAEIAREGQSGLLHPTKAGFLLDSRMEAESLITSVGYPRKFVGAFVDGVWTYARTNSVEGVRDFFTQQGVKTFYARGLDWLLHECLEEAGISIAFTEAETVRNALDLWTYINNDNLEGRVQFRLWDLQRFYSENPFAGIETYADIEKFQSNKYMYHPPEDQSWKFVAQAHVRGLSVHIDLRFEISKTELVGWTFDALKSLIKPMIARYTEESVLSGTGLTKTQIKGMEIKEVSQRLNGSKEGKALLKELSEKVEGLSDGAVEDMVHSLISEELNPILQTPETKILLQTKEPEPHEWLTYKGKVSPGQVGATAEFSGRFFIIDSGTVEYGALKDYYFEYWLHGNVFKNNHLVIRRLPTAPKWELKSAFAWMGFFTLPDKLPYTITKRAIEKNYMPPQGISALPKSIRSQVPSVYQYWTKKGKEAEQTRTALVTAIKKKDVVIKLAAGLRFAIKQFWYRGPVHIRGTPNMFFYLIFHDGQKVIKSWDFGEENPVDQSVTTTRLGKTKDPIMLKKVADLSPKHILNPTEELPLHMDTIDEGPVQLIADSSNFLRFRLGGKTFKGLYVLYREDPRSTEWFFKKAELPKIVKKALYGAYTGLVQVPIENIEVKELDDLLIVSGPFLRPGEMIGLDMRPAYFTEEAVAAITPTGVGTPIVVMHGDLKGDVVGYVQKVSLKTVPDLHDKNKMQQVGFCDVGIIWHPKAIELILKKVLPDFSIEVLPKSLWDPENQREIVVGGTMVGLGVVTRGAGEELHIQKAVLVNPATHEIKRDIRLQKKFGLPLSDYLRQRYWQGEASTVDLAQEFNLSETAIKKMFSSFGIPRRTLEQAAEVRQSKDRSARSFGATVSVSFLGTNCEEKLPREDCECPQCMEARKGGLSRRNHSALLLTYGGENIIVDAPEEIVDMLALKKLRPEHVLITHAHPDHAGGLKYFTSPSINVYATKDTWDQLQVDKLPFKKRVIKDNEPFQINGFTITSHKVVHSTLAPTNCYKIKIGERVILYAPDVLEIPNRKQVLENVDIYVGDGDGISRGIVRTDKKERRVGHASIKEQIKWANEAQIPEILFTHIGHVEKTHEELTKEIQKMAPNATAMFDGASFMLTDENPGHKLPEGQAKLLWEGKKRIIVSTMPYMKYATKTIFFIDEDKVYGRMVEGFPEGPFDADKVRIGLRKYHQIPDNLWDKWFKGHKQVYIFRPRIISTFPDPLPYKPEKGQQVYVRNVKILPRR